MAGARIEREPGGWITQLYGVEEGIIVTVITILLVVRDERKIVIMVRHPRGRSKFRPIPGLPPFDEGKMLW